MALPAFVARICRATGISLAALQQGSRRASVARARAGIAYLAIERYGYPGVALRDWLGVGAPSIVKAAQRGRAAHTHWDPPGAGDETRKAMKEATSRKLVQDETQKAMKEVASRKRKPGSLTKERR